MRVYTFGSNIGAQLAMPDEFEESYKPLKIPFFDGKKIQKLACGTLHTIALVDNKVYTWGCNDEFALGRIGKEHEVLPVDLGLTKGSKVIDVCAGSSHSAVLTDKGSVYAWGTFRDSSGIIGFAKNVKFQKTARFIQRSVRFISSANNVLTMVKNNGDIISYGADLWKPRSALTSMPRKAALKKYVSSRVVRRYKKTDSRIISLNSGANHVLTIHENGKVSSWGNNFCGQQGIGSKICNNTPQEVKLPGKAKKAEGGITHSLFLNEKGELYGAGENSYGQLNSTIKESLVPIKIDDNVIDCRAFGTMTMILKKDGLYTCGANFYGELGHDSEETNMVKSIKKIEYDFGQIIQIACGNNHSIVITK